MELGLWRRYVPGGWRYVLLVYGRYHSCVPQCQQLQGDPLGENAVRLVSHRGSYTRAPHQQASCCRSPLTSSSFLRVARNDPRHPSEPSHWASGLTRNGLRDRVCQRMLHSISILAVLNDAECWRSARRSSRSSWQYTSRCARTSSSTTTIPFTCRTTRKFWAD